MDIASIFVDLRRRGHSLEHYLAAHGSAAGVADCASRYAWRLPGFLPVQPFWKPAAFGALDYRRVDGHVHHGGKRFHPGGTDFAYGRRRGPGWTRGGYGDLL